MKKARCIMVQGTMSSVGKSLLCAALCRIFKQDGLRVAPFKSQNMALNSYVTRDGLEMGRAQVMQAEAAGLEADVRMNPILLKPSSDTGSQVIVGGEVRGQMSATQYLSYKKSLIPEILAAYHSLASEYDLIVIEGAGSPAEINLKTDDIVNMGFAKLVDAPVLLAGDIDRGGVFAQLYGTVALLEEEERQRIGGLIINKFRGDPALLRPGLAMLEEKTALPVLGVIPYFKQLTLDDEDSLAPCLSQTKQHKAVDLAVIRLPRLSNFTDFAPLETHPALGVRYVETLSQLGSPDLILLPGTKNTMDDLLWLRQNGLESAIQAFAFGGTPILGICGGYQMLGRSLRDPESVEGGLPDLRGMGLLPCDTIFVQDKTRSRIKATVLAECGCGATLDAYEIHMGQTKVYGKPFCLLEDGRPNGCAQGTVFGTYLHGLFDSGELVEKLANWLCQRKQIPLSQSKPQHHLLYKELQYETLAAGVREALDMQAVYQMIERGNEERNVRN